MDNIYRYQTSETRYRVTVTYATHSSADRPARSALCDGSILFQASGSPRRDAKGRWVVPGEGAFLDASGLSQAKSQTLPEGAK